MNGKEEEANKLKHKLFRLEFFNLQPVSMEVLLVLPFVKSRPFLEAFPAHVTQSQGQVWWQHQGQEDRTVPAAQFFPHIAAYLTSRSTRTCLFLSETVDPSGSVLSTLTDRGFPGFPAGVFPSPSWRYNLRLNLGRSARQMLCHYGPFPTFLQHFPILLQFWLQTFNDAM